MKPALVVRVVIFFILAEMILGVLFYLSDMTIWRVILVVSMSGIFLVCIAGFLYAWFDR